MMSFLADLCPASWSSLLAAEFNKPYFLALEEFLQNELKKSVVFPPLESVFRALELVPPAAVKVVILGQDPYHEAGQANGLAFSVSPQTPMPPSLKNIFKELKSDLSLEEPKNGDLTPWAEQGVILLNTVLTVRAHQADTHRKHGWEEFTSAIIRLLAASKRPLVFALWGRAAQKKGALIDKTRHVVLEAAHPSPLSARFWFGSKPFSKINSSLTKLGYSPINWQL